MPRPVILSNGRMLVGLNQFGFVHDFYYPYIGLENHTTARIPNHKIGVWVDGVFSWVNSYGWQRSIDFNDDCLISKVNYTSEELQLRIEFNDFVDCDYNVFSRIGKVHNLKEEGSREVRIFMHQAFQIMNSDRGDTALYEPDGNYILDYKGRNIFLIYAREENHQGFDQYSIGLSGIEGKEGTYKDAEDGELSGNPVEHGMVDSTIRLRLEVSKSRPQGFEYWIIAAPSQQDALHIHDVYEKVGARARLDQTKDRWKHWLMESAPGLQRINAEYLPLAKKSLLVVKSHIDRRGSILASADSEMLNYARDNYSYFWPRDGVYALWPLIKLGYKDEAKGMFEFCRDVLHPEGFLEHKFQPDRAIGSTWHPLVHQNRRELAIQEDETASVIYILGRFLQATGDEDFVRGLYTTLIKPAANFMEKFIDHQTKLPHASYDLWEEKFATHTYSVAVTYASLVTAAGFADRFDSPDDAIRWQSAADDIKSASNVLYNPEKKYFHKSLLLGQNGKVEHDDTIDVSSLYGAVMYGLFDKSHEFVVSSVETIEKELLVSAPCGGLPRYEFDRYSQQRPKYKGNPWFVTTLWLAQLYILMGRHDDAKKLIDWCLGHKMSSGILSEQIDPDTGEGLSVAPLVWSHAEFIRTVLMF